MSADFYEAMNMLGAGMAFIFVLIVVGLFDWFYGDSLDEQVQDRDQWELERQDDR